jgi:hypothetical protein
MKPFAHCLSLALCFGLSTMVACGGGGGGGGSTVTPKPKPKPKPKPEPKNKGSYKIEEFQYKDTLPKSYQPFGGDEFTLLREELTAFIKGYKSNRDGMVFDDHDSEHAEVSPIPRAVNPTTVFDTASGQLDDDFMREVVVVGLVNDRIVSRRQHKVVNVRILEMDARGNMVQKREFNIPGSVVNASLTLADVDGDGRDEIIVASATGTFSTTGNKNPLSDGGVMRIYDDSIGGHALLRKVDDQFTAKGEVDVRAAAGDLDGDGRAEVVLLERYRSWELRARVFDDARSMFTVLKTFSNVKPSDFQPFDQYQSGTYEHTWNDMDVVIGNFDGDDREEIVFCGTDVYSGTYWRAARFDDARSATPFGLMDKRFDLIGPRRVRGGIYDEHRSWQLLAVDLDVQGPDELILCAGADDGGNPSRYDISLTRVSFDDVWVGPRKIFQLVVGLHNRTGSRAAVVYDSLTHRPHLVVAAVARDLVNTAFPKLRFYRIGQALEKPDPKQPNKQLRRMLVKTDEWTINMPKSTASRNEPITPYLASGDLQGDSMGVKYTGDKSLKLSDPMPICVMAAPPTKAGISQVVGNSRVIYAKSTARSESHKITSGMTVSAELGVQFDFFKDFVSVDARATYEQSVEKAHGRSTEVVKTVSYVGGYESNHIIFQGIIYRSYKYRVLASRDRDLIGTHISIDVPVASRVYKWTLDYYNKKVTPENRIDVKALLGNTIGDPATYLTEAEARSRAGRNGWLSNSQTVGQGSQSNSASVEITKANSVEKTRKVTTGVKGELKVGPFVTGGSLGIANGSVYSIETAFGTSFEGSVGDIPKTSDYEEWEYTFGLALYHHGGGQTGQRGFQVIHFWTVPTGASY